MGFVGVACEKKGDGNEFWVIVSVPGDGVDCAKLYWLRSPRELAVIGRREAGAAAGDGGPDLKLEGGLDLAVCFALEMGPIGL